ncbi:hypothetical protein [Dulcicalothrix desertica]|nr:hypothetical protein [Dulcicalothrix desertica]TWH61191.1 hypothetical protein CAL7102_01046 [Dulcicalothrix desertica PCC 7102]
MDNFLEEIEQYTNAFSQPEESGAITTNQQQQDLTNTQIQNPENHETWFTTAAEAQDYEVLNQEIESDRTTSKIYATVGSGLTALGANSCLGNAVLETTYNPTCYMVFSGVIAASLISAGLSGSRINGKTFYSSPWLLSSLGASAGVVGGTYAASRPYFEDKNIASKAHESIATEIREIEVRPQQSNGFDLTGLWLGIAALIAVGFFAIKK